MATAASERADAAAYDGVGSGDVMDALISRLEQEAERAGSLTSRLKHLIAKKLCISRLHWGMRMWSKAAARERYLTGAYSQKSSSY